MTEIVCPSGLSLQIRHLRVRLQRLLTDKQLARRGEQVTRLLAESTEAVLDAGPYELSDKGVLDWADVLEGDRLFALIQIRVATHGPSYEFDIPCPTASCDPIEWELDLNDLPVQPLSEDSRTKFIAGNRFETHLPHADRTAWFKLLTGKDERARTRLARQLGELGAAIRSRVVEIDDVEPNRLNDFVDDLSFADADHLLDVFDRVDCGVETTIDVQCPECFAKVEVELPFDRGFFLPGGQRKARRKSRSSNRSRSKSGAKGSSTSSGASTAGAA